LPLIDLIDFSICRVIEALNSTSLSLIAGAAYFPQFVQARVSAALIFHMIEQKPTIDNLSDEEGLKPVGEQKLQHLNIF
jgi:hypothetical protein